MAIKRLWHPSPNYSSRGGVKPRLIVVHTTEGATSNQNLANFICQSSAGVSYHVSVDSLAGGVCYEYVARGNKSWSVCNFNPAAVCGVFCTPLGASANWSRNTWLTGQATALANMGAWVAEEAAILGIPLVALTSGQAQGGAAGVCQHANLGSAGCGHVDCGPGFPMDELMRLAAGAPLPQPEPIPPAAPLFPLLKASDRHMAAITQAPHAMPVPDGATKFIVAADVAAQNVNHVVVNLRFHITGTKDWQEVRLDLVTERPVSPTYSLNGRDAVSMTMEDTNLQAGYAFS